jgi:hypothetical protein
MGYVQLSSFLVNLTDVSLETVTWLSSSAVTQLVLDAIDSELDLDAVVNVIHPCTTPFNSVMDAVNAALVKKGIVSQPLPSMVLNSWVGELEKTSVNLTSADMAAKVRSCCVISMDLSHNLNSQL